LKLCVFVIDDDEFNREHLGLYLEDGGYDVIMAEDGPEALEILFNNDHQFNTILLDKNMPKMDGFDVLRKIKASPTFQNIPIIIQTAEKDTEQVAEGIREGAYYYLTKPYDPGVMLTIVKSAIDEWRLYHSLREDLDSRKGALSNLYTGHFRFQTIDQAHDLAKLIALICPDPESAIIGLVELMLNAVEHGNLGIGYDQKTDLKVAREFTNEIIRRQSAPEYADKFVDVYVENGDDEITIKIEDQGPGFDWTKYLKFDPSRGTHAHGRGIAMAGLSGFSSLEYQGRGNKVIVKIQTSKN
jgi:phosphoserine phosphatase RsbU/P